jgi:hypothetical protein
MRRFTGKLLILVAVFCVVAAMAAAQDKSAAAATSSVPGVRGEFLDELAYGHTVKARVTPKMSARRHGCICDS